MNRYKPGTHPTARLTHPKGILTRRSSPEILGTIAGLSALGKFLKRTEASRKAGKQNASGKHNFEISH
jgi:hypothetical protein